MTTPTRSRVAREIDAPALRSAIGEALNRRPAVGLAVGVVGNGRLEFFHAHGLADVEARTPITEDTVFRVGSITKTFTAIAVMQLWERGLVDLDVPANDYLRAFRLVPRDPSFRPVTLRHLLTHTAGLPEVVHPKLGWWLLGETLKPSEPVPPLREYYGGALPVLADPGTRFRYTDHAFATLGQVVADVTGRTLDAYLRENVFEPLGMIDTELLRSERLRHRVAAGYTLGRRGPRRVADYNLVTVGAGGAYSTIRDMARFAAALLGGGANEEGSVLKPDTLEYMFRPHYQPDARIPGDGLVFSRASLGGYRAVWHGGILPDFVSQMWLAPDDGVGLLAFTNGSRSAHLWLPSEAGRWLGTLIGAPEDAIRTDVPQHPEAWPELCGFYELEADLFDVRARAMFGAGAEVFVRGGQLLARVITPIPALYHGFVLHPDDPDDPHVFRVDLSRWGIPPARVVFSGEPGKTVTRAHFELHPLSLEKQPQYRNPRPWATAALAALTAAVATTAARRLSCR